MSARTPRERWDLLDPSAPPSIDWVHPIGERRCVVLLGAFDPPTNAHVAIAREAGRVVGAPPVLAMTKTMLARPNDELFSPVQRVDLLTRITAQENLGLLLANRGTYLDVSRALRTAAVEATFVIGSDKLPQLADPAFYADGEHGVAATFAEVRLVVVPRDGTEVDRDDVAVIDPREVFPAGTRDERLARLSGTEIRRKVAAGEPVEDLVPQAVAVALGGYTAAR